MRPASDASLKMYSVVPTKILLMATMFPWPRLPVHTGLPPEFADGRIGHERVVVNQCPARRVGDRIAGQLLTALDGSAETVLGMVANDPQRTAAEGRRRDEGQSSLACVIEDRRVDVSAVRTRAVGLINIVHVAVAGVVVDIDVGDEIGLRAGYVNAGRETVERVVANDHPAIEANRLDGDDFQRVVLDPLPICPCKRFLIEHIPQPVGRKRIVFDENMVRAGRRVVNGHPRVPEDTIANDDVVAEVDVDGV